MDIIILRNDNLGVICILGCYAEGYPTLEENRLQILLREHDRSLRLIDKLQVGGNTARLVDLPLEFDPIEFDVKTLIIVVQRGCGSLFKGQFWHILVWRLYILMEVEDIRKF